VIDQALAAPSARVKARHVGLGAGLVKEYQPARIGIG